MLILFVLFDTAKLLQKTMPRNRTFGAFVIPQVWYLGVLRYYLLKSVTSQGWMTAAFAADCVALTNFCVMPLGA